METSKKLITAAAVAAMGFSLLITGASASDEIGTARKAVGELAGSLKKSLGDALSAGGPVGALAACRVIAPEAAQNVSAAHALSIKRTALRLRNPDNAPDEHERRVLESFVEQIKAGADPMQLENTEVIEAEGNRTLRYMKPIMMAEKPCAACHGSSINPDVTAAISEIYPKDAATNFAPGDVRGAFSVTMPLPRNP